MFDLSWLAALRQRQTGGQDSMKVGHNLRIALLGSRGFPHTYSGYEVFIGEVAPRLVSRGHEVIVYCRKSLFEKRPKTCEGVQLAYLPSIETKVLSTPTHTLLSMF